MFCDDNRADIDDSGGISATDALSRVPLIDGMREYFGGAVSDGYDRLTFLKLTALLHDVAKPATKTIEASGRIRFIGHHIEGERAVREILTRLRFAKRRRGACGADGAPSPAPNADGAKGRYAHPRARCTDTTATPAIPPWTRSIST